MSDATDRNVTMTTRGLEPDGEDDSEEARLAAEHPYVDYDSGWGTTEELEEWEEEQDNEWRLAGKLIGDLIHAMSINSFLHIQYGRSGVGHATPYARATLGVTGVLCEIISADGLSTHQWRLSAHWLSTNGWTAPNANIPNWHKAGVPSKDAASEILTAFRFGRHPMETTELRWSVDQVPRDLGPLRGVTLEAALKGTVQTIANAS
jgi:hypothetical protein